LEDVTESNKDKYMFVHATPTHMSNDAFTWGIGLWRERVQYYQLLV